MTNIYEEIEVKTLEVACDGGGGALGHPRVYLHIDSEQGKIVCPYCSRTYLLAKNAKLASGGH